MKRLKNAIAPNSFISGSEQTATISLLNTYFNDLFYNTNNELGHLKEYSYICAQLGYSDWSLQPDVFRYVYSRYLNLIKEKKCFFIFDASHEGNSPTGDYSIFDYLQESCKRHKIDPEMIIYLSSNLKDEANIKDWSMKTKNKPFNVVSFTLFEYILTLADAASIPQPFDYPDTLPHYHQAKADCKSAFRSKYFSSLSRINRPERSAATFMLSNHPVSNRALISHNVLNNNDKINLLAWAKENNISEKKVNKWSNRLPLIIDNTDFNVNWALTPEWTKIFDQTIFHVVNETLVNNVNNTSLFYSEKTFKPILKFQPFVIYGQPGCNHYLQELGYKLYDDWFDLSFDFEEDSTLRYKKLLHSVEQACAKLDSMSDNEKIKWRFKNEEILRHNYAVLINSKYTKNKLYQFFKNLSNNKLTNT